MCVHPGTGYKQVLDPLFKSQCSKTLILFNVSSNCYKYFVAFSRVAMILKFHFCCGNVKMLIHLHSVKVESPQAI